MSLLQLQLQLQSLLVLNATTVVVVVACYNQYITYISQYNLILRESSNVLILNRISLPPINKILFIFSSIVFKIEK